MTDPHVAFPAAVHRYVNPITRPVAKKLPTFAILTHRASGRTYRTPINVFRRGDEYFFFLTYGSDVQWVKNIRYRVLLDRDTRDGSSNSSSRMR